MPVREYGGGATALLHGKPIIPAQKSRTMTAEWLLFEQPSPRGEQMRMALSSVVPVKTTRTYRGGSDLLFLWGPGHPARFGPMREQVARGGHVVALDLAYWQRDQKIRISIDAAHPQRWVMRTAQTWYRFLADGVPLGDLYDPNGFVLIAGIGEKAKVQYGHDVIARWEARMAAECQARGWPVVYRRKNAKGEAPAGVPVQDGGSIERALKGCRLVLTWHSNVAIDAIRMNVPVVCIDGAAAAVCPSDIPDVPMPLDQTVRRQFLHNLAHFQWAPTEAAQMWDFLAELLS